MAARGDRRLTPRERDVLRLVAAGMTNRQIANRCHVVEDTIKSQLRVTMRTIGAANRTEAATRFILQADERDMDWLRRHLPPVLPAP